MDGKGLILVVKPPGARSWIYRYKTGTKQHWMGLGPYPDVSLADARERADEARKQRRAGVDPLANKRATKTEQQAKDRTFRVVAREYVESHKAGWSNDKHAKQWVATLEAHAYPVIGDLEVGEITLDHMKKVLEPIWQTKTETASRVRGRIETVLDYAGVHGWRSGDNPARWDGFLSEVLPAKGRVAKVEHHAAMAWADAPAFWSDLACKDAISYQTLKFTILTAARSGEARGARWSEIDLAAKLWTIPGERMKAKRPHRVPLNDAALAVLEAVKDLKHAPDDLVFPSGVKKTVLSDVGLSKALHALSDGLTIHGFRSTFRDWCAEVNHCPREIAEAALAHTNRDKVEAAYARTDHLERRRVLMADWGKFLKGRKVLFNQ